MWVEVSKHLVVEVGFCLGRERPLINFDRGRKDCVCVVGHTRS